MRAGLNYQIEHHLFPYRRITRYLNINALPRPFRCPLVALYRA